MICEWSVLTLAQRDLTIVISSTAKDSLEGALGRFTLEVVPYNIKRAYAAGDGTRSKKVFV